MDHYPLMIYAVISAKAHVNTVTMSLGVPNSSLFCCMNVLASTMIKMASAWCVANSTFNYHKLHTLLVCVFGTIKLLLSSMHEGICAATLAPHWSIGLVLLQFKVLPQSGWRDCFIHRSWGCGLVLWGLGTWPAITATPSAHCTVKYHSSSGSPK